MTHYNLKTLRFNLLAMISIFVLVYLAASLETWRPYHKPVVSKESSVINFTPKFYQVFTLGHSRLVSSILWVATLLESDVEHYKGSGNSWMYFRFLTISKLEPRFYLNYLYGGQYLAIAKDDVYGADTIYSLGLKNYPKDFWLSYHAGFNAAFEIGDNSLALEYYDNIYHHPLVQEKYPTLLSIINKLKLQNGNLSLEQIFNLLESTWSNTPPGNVKMIIGDYLYAIKAEVDLECLNSGLNVNSCNRADFNGEPYIMTSDHQWKAIKTWSRFRLKGKKKGSN